MKKFTLLFILISSFVYGGDPEDLPDFTAPFSLRSLATGDLLAPDYRKPNWNLKQVDLDEQIRKSDPFDKFNLGAMQFVNADDPKSCLGIDESGFFALKNCEEDLKSKKLEAYLQLFLQQVLRCKFVLLFWIKQNVFRCFLTLAYLQEGALALLLVV